MCVCATSLYSALLRILFTPRVQDAVMGVDQLEPEQCCRFIPRHTWRVQEESKRGETPWGEHTSLNRSYAKD